MSSFWILFELRMIEVVVTNGAIRRATLQSNCHHRQTNTQLFTGRMRFLSPNQQCHSTEGKSLTISYQRNDQQQCDNCTLPPMFYSSVTYIRSSDAQINRFSVSNTSIPASAGNSPLISFVATLSTLRRKKTIIRWPTIDWCCR